MTRHYYSLLNLLKDQMQLAQSSLNDLDVGNTVIVSSSKLIKYIAVWASGTSGSEYDKDEMNTLFCTYIYPKYKNMIVSYVDKEDDTDPTTTDKEYAYKEFLIHLLNRIRTSYGEYQYLITTLSTQKTHLMDDLKTQTKFNDTPQSLTTAGVVSYSDNYNTNVTTNFSDGGTKISRIAEIENLLKDYYEMWCNYVCKGLFMHEG